MRKKNNQYYKSKRRVLKYKDPTQATINAIKISTQIAISAIQVQIALQSAKTGIPDYSPGGITAGKSMQIVGEEGAEIASAKSALDKRYLVIHGGTKLNMQRIAKKPNIEGLKATIKNIIEQKSREI